MVTVADKIHYSDPETILWKAQQATTGYRSLGWALMVPILPLAFQTSGTGNGT